MNRAWLTVCTAAVLAGTLATPGTAATQLVIDALLGDQRFSVSDMRALRAGEAVVKSLDTPVRQELAHFGVVYLNVSADRFITSFRDIERFESGPGIPQIGRFGTPPRLEDLAGLTLPAKDVSALSKCRPGDCDVKLSSAAMGRFRDRVDWSSPNAASQATAVMRENLLELVRTYQATGNAALGQYDDGGEPVPVAEQFRALLASGLPQPLAMPEMMAYLDDYPRGRPTGASEFYYWSVVDFGLKPTIRVNHVVIQPLPDPASDVSHVIAIKQLYASHYFHTTLELRILANDSRRTDRLGFHLLSITRSRNDGTTGLTGALLRPIISRRSRNAVRRYLEHMKQQVETLRVAPSAPVSR